EEVIAVHLVPQAEAVAQRRAEHPGVPTTFFLDVLGEFDEASSTTAGNAIRRKAGGALPDPRSGGYGDDGVKEILCRLACDAYPQLLVPVEEWWRVSHLMLFHHPLRREVEAAIAADDTLARLYPEVDMGLG